MPMQSPVSKAKLYTSHGKGRPLVIQWGLLKRFRIETGRYSLSWIHMLKPAEADSFVYDLEGPMPSLNVSTPSTSTNWLSFAALW